MALVSSVFLFPAHGEAGKLGNEALDSLRKGVLEWRFDGIRLGSWFSYFQFFLIMYSIFLPPIMARDLRLCRYYIHSLHFLIMFFYSSLQCCILLLYNNKCNNIIALMC